MINILSSVLIRLWRGNKAEKCPHSLEIGDDFGDNESTHKCQLAAGHLGKCRETWEYRRGKIALEFEHNKLPVTYSRWSLKLVKYQFDENYSAKGEPVDTREMKSPGIMNEDQALDWAAAEIKKLSTDQPEGETTFWMDDLLMPIETNPMEYKVCME